MFHSHTKQQGQNTINYHRSSHTYQAAPLLWALLEECILNPYQKYTVAKKYLVHLFVTERE